MNERRKEGVDVILGKSLGEKKKRFQTPICHTDPLVSMMKTLLERVLMHCECNFCCTLESHQMRATD